MVRITKENFSLRQIGESGQCFRLAQLEDERYSLVAFGRYLEAEQRGKEICFHCTQEEFETVWKEYFDLDTDYGAILALVDEKDDYLKSAAAYGSGLRILRQDIWEMVVSFIISQQNHIKRIRRCIDFLCTRYGEERLSGAGKPYYAFPTPERLAQVPLNELQACNLGYRSRYISETSRSVAGGGADLASIGRMEYHKAKEELRKLCGVGEKVADCICLFALHHLDAFPKDTHINKVLAERYGQGFPFDAYRGCAGVLQQYIFYYDLMREKTC